MKLYSILPIVIFAVSACSSDRYAVASDKTVSVFLNETDAGYEGSLNRDQIEPIATLQQGERVLVLKDTYGKDYWACKIRLQNNTIGWALCTNFNFQGSR
tara:strand:+ start:337 stop:636 length:300 start_codon:yes stop_codon:yes gene_type:complete